MDSGEFLTLIFHIQLIVQSFSAPFFTSFRQPNTLSSASTMMAISMMGGVFAILPAYEADLFGTKFVGAIHGRMLLFSSAAALAGKNSKQFKLIDEKR